MSYLKGILAAKKVWRVFTTKLQTKLHKLNKSKAIKKPKKNQVHTTHSRVWPSLSFQSRFKRKGRNTKQSHTIRYKTHNYPRKRTKPVYIDQLFIQSTLDQPSTSTAAGAGNWSPSVKIGRVIDCVGTSRGDGKNHTADDMWESLVLASPQMHGINERAEEFITRFRAELQVQEMMDRQL